MKAVIWDLGGTLIDTFTPNLRNLKRLLKQESIEEKNDSKIITLMKNSITDTVKYYKENYGFSDKSIEEFLYLNKNVKGEETSLYSGAIEILRYINSSRKNEFFVNA